MKAEGGRGKGGGKSGTHHFLSGLVKCGTFFRCCGCQSFAKRDIADREEIHPNTDLTRARSKRTLGLNGRRCLAIATKCLLQSTAGYSEARDSRTRVLHEEFSEVYANTFTASRVVLKSGGV